MAEAKHSGSKNFGKVLQKTVFRTKEKVLQNLGKADKTHDDEFDNHVTNFTKQQATATKLQKELKNYILCVKAMSAASKTFYETIRETYEDSWAGHSEVTGATEALTAIWEDYLLKLTNQVQDPVTAYVTRFPEIKQKISKRNRKLMDYDGTRHTLESVNAQKKKDDAKIQKATEDMEFTKRIYNEINSELHHDLPSLYENRKSVLSSVLNSLFSCEGKFQEECAKIKNSLADATERLNRECSDVFFKQYNHTSPLSSLPRDRSSTSSSTPPSDKLKLHPKFVQHSPSDRSSNRSNSTRSSRQGSTGGDINASPASVRLEKEHPETRLSSNITTNGDHITNTPASPTISVGDDGAYENIMMESSTTENTIVNDESIEKISEPMAGKKNELTNNNETKVDDSDQSDSSSEDEGVKGQSQEEAVYSVATEDDDTYRIPTNNQPVQSSLPGGVLYQVQATHPYTGDDIDELTFEVGDVINVVEFEDPEDQDDGWLMGFKLVSGERGVFPENFTKRL